ncbi:hypothetical protein D1610_11125, partial [Sphingomonas gilva]
GSRLAAHGQQFATSGASAIAYAATRSLATGTSFGDNIIASLPSVIGQTIGGMLGDAINGAFAGNSRTGKAGGIGLDPGDPLISGDVTPSGAELVAALSPLPYLGEVPPSAAELAAAANGYATVGGNTAGNGRPRGSVYLEYDGQILEGGPANGISAANAPRIVARPTPEWMEGPDGLRAFGYYYQPDPSQNPYFVDAISPEAWENSRFDRLAGSFMDTVVTSGQEIAGGLSDLVVGLASMAQLGSDIIALTPASMTRNHERAQAFSAWWNDPSTSVTGAIFNATAGQAAHVVDQLFTHDNLRPMTTYVAGSALGARFAPGLTFNGTVNQGVNAGYAARLAAGGTFDLGVSGSRYALSAPAIAGFQRATGTVNTRAFVVHGNSAASPRTAYLYELYSTDGTFLKNGITQNMDTRYSKAFMKDKYMLRVDQGSRADMIALERQRTIANPGPLNREPWAIKARNIQ